LDIKESHRDISATQEKLNKTRDLQTHKSDALRLQLQNLQYEAYHLRKKIAQCKQFASRHTQINLVPVEEFMANAPLESTEIDGTQSDEGNDLINNKLT
jgi:THO complex subunit 5